MRKTFIFAASALVALCASCAKEEISAPEGNTVLTATFENTKTALAEDNQVVWVAGDKVSVFEGSANVEATAESAGASTTLTATLTTGGPWYALYPYNADATLSDGKINAALSDAQTAVAGTFAPNSNIAVAYSETTALQFKNVHAFIKFTLSNDLVKSIELKGNNDETVAGKISIDYNAGTPSVEVSEAKTAITIAPASGYFEKDKAYYIAVLPVAFTQGFTLTLTDAFGETQDITTDKSVTLQRSHILNIGTPDSDITVDDIIVFADPDVEADIVKAFDKNGDGKLSKSEAAAVTYAEFTAFDGTATSNVCAASSIWTDPLKVDTFDEFKYFIGLARTASDFRMPILFAQCTNLTSTILPYNITEVSNYAFQNCGNLLSITLPEKVRAVYSRAFQNCAKMTKLTFAAGADNVLSQVSAYGFSGCKKMTLSTRNLKKLKTIGTYAFENCEAIANLTIISPDLTTIPRNAFYQCKKLVNVYISPNVTQIDQFAFSGCIAMTGFSYEGTGKTGINLPEGLTTLGNAAFGGCEQIKDVIFPSTVTSIGNNVFRTETVNSTTRTIILDTWTIKATTVPALGTETFKYKSVASDAGSVAHIYVPAASVDDYKAAANWNAFASVISAIE